MNRWASYSVHYHENDSKEENNLAEDAEYAEIKHALQAALLALTANAR